jgi:hypothetical protein
MNFESQGEPIAIINAKKYETKHNNPVLMLGDEANHVFNNIRLNDGETFQLIPNTSKERDVLYVVGQSGSGKSYFCAQYLREYNRIYPKRKIYMFSTVQEDSELDSLKNFHRVKIDDEFVADDDIPMEEFKDSAVLLDDVDNLKPLYKKKVMSLADSILQTGRHWNITCLMTYHVATSGNETRKVLNECRSVTFNPKTMGNRALRYLLDAYLGLDAKQVEYIKHLKGRMVTVCKSYPKVVISEREAYVLE